jgi:hypothetical protein
LFAGCLTNFGGLLDIYKNIAKCFYILITFCGDGGGGDGDAWFYAQNGSFFSFCEWLWFFSSWKSGVSAGDLLLMLRLMHNLSL